MTVDEIGRAAEAGIYRPEIERPANDQELAMLRQVAADLAHSLPEWLRAEIDDRESEE